MIRAIDDLAIRLMWIPRIIIAAGILSLAWFAADRKEPFEVLSVEPAYGYPGGTVRIVAQVRRDASRDCNADFSRYLYASDETRFDLGSSSASARMISALELRTPGRLVVSVTIPEEAKPGPARVETVLAYRCNAVHNLWPIPVTVEMPFFIREP